MHSRAAVAFILAALIAAVILPSPAAAIPMEDDTVDRPNTDYPALFRAFLDLGHALFGTWTPEGAIEEFIRKREAEGLSQ
ncbi:uncharacterized protein LOC6531152 [Drosophila yakuba]|uniref:Uncharacterized protein n=1 Tax=Drosophila yakuba TaxID=7245 RepID=B4P4S0_DROYA|nr:uncharacterized protein LOC6531152 [Drosophila yakuba]XP_039482663.1 uncharacterized protein LOC120445996 [Drosophila santomea]EDW91693.1 uncharacterized protein Dyak_GE11921 [Drosophila yakuba]